MDAEKPAAKRNGGSIAWGDESLKMASSCSQYMVAAVLLPCWTHVEEAALRALLPKGQHKLHWYDMVPELKRKSIAAISNLSWSGLIVSASPVQLNKQERARRKCLRTLFPLVEQIGVGTLVLESRTANQDKRDVRLLDGLRGSREVKRIRLEHERGRDKAQLWVPDQLLGLYGDMLKGDELALDLWQGPSRKIDVFDVRME